MRLYLHTMEYAAVVMTAMLFLLKPLQPLSLKQTKAVRWPLFDNTVFAESLLFDKRAKSLADCARACLSREFCAMFTLLSVSSPPSSASKSFQCRGHSGVKRPSDDPGSQTIPGIRFFVFTPRISAWLKTPCNSTADCQDIAAFTDCYPGGCVCHPGRYYSHISDSCVQTCAKQDQQKDYTHYPAYRLERNNVKCENITLAECMVECQAHSDCRSFEKWKFANCCLNRATPQTAPSDFTSALNANYYIMTCL